MHNRKLPELFNQGDTASWTTYCNITDHSQEPPNQHFSEQKQSTSDARSQFLPSYFSLLPSDFCACSLTRCEQLCQATHQGVVKPEEQFWLVVTQRIQLDPIQELKRKKNQTTLFFSYDNLHSSFSHFKVFHCCYRIDNNFRRGLDIGASNQEADQLHKQYDMSTRDNQRGYKSMRKQFKSGVLTFLLLCDLFPFHPSPTPLLHSQKFPWAHGSYTATATNGQSFFSSIIASHSICAQTSAFFHSSTRETDDGKEEECGKFGKQMTKNKNTSQMEYTHLIRSKICN